MQGMGGGLPVGVLSVPVGRCRCSQCAGVLSVSGRWPGVRRGCCGWMGGGQGEGGIGGPSHAVAGGGLLAAAGVLLRRRSGLAYHSWLRPSAGLAGRCWLCQPAGRMDDAVSGVCAAAALLWAARAQHARALVRDRVCAAAAAQVQQKQQEVVQLPPMPPLVPALPPTPTSSHPFRAWLAVVLAGVHLSCLVCAPASHRVVRCWQGLLRRRQPLQRHPLPHPLQHPAGHHVPAGGWVGGWGAEGWPGVLGGRRQGLPLEAALAGLGAGHTLPRSALLAGCVGLHWLVAGEAPRCPPFQCLMHEVPSCRLIARSTTLLS